MVTGPMGTRTDRDDAPLRRAFATALRRLREDRSMTQEDLAFAAGVGRVSIAQMETGRRLPSLPTAFRLAAGLGVTAAELVGRVEAAGQE